MHPIGPTKPVGCLCACVTWGLLHKKDAKALKSVNLDEVVYGLFGIDAEGSP
jgi:hypothetical protein